MLAMIFFWRHFPNFGFFSEFYHHYHPWNNVGKWDAVEWGAYLELCHSFPSLSNNIAKLKWRWDNFPLSNFVILTRHHHLSQPPEGWIELTTGKLLGKIVFDVLIARPQGVCWGWFFIWERCLYMNIMGPRRQSHLENNVGEKLWEMEWEILKENGGRVSH